MRKLNGYGPSLIVLATAMIVLVLGPSVVKRLTYAQTQTRMIQASNRLATGNILGELDQAFRDIATFVEPSVVHISAQQSIADRRGASALSSGSGWVYDEQGHIVTNYHVVQDAERIEVQLASGELRQADMVGFDPSTDIAVVRVPPGHLHPALLGTPGESVGQGELVFAFGSPFDFRFSMSSGIISGQGRHVDVLGRAGYENFIQVDAAINPGNSGGPLTDHRGRVIGMNTAIATGKRSSLEDGQFAGIGLAIPLDMIVPVVSQIIDKGFVDKGLLGVVPRELNVAVAQEFGFIGSGVLIEGVREDGPAARAGVRPSDIVTEVNGKSVGSMSQLRSVISSMLPGDVAELTIYRPDPENRTGETIAIAVTLDRLNLLRDSGELPPNQPLDRIVELGIQRMSTSTPEGAERLGAGFHRGVLIEEIAPGSELAQLLAPGSTVITVMDYPVRDVEELVTTLRQYNLRIGVQVGVIAPDGRYDRVILRVSG